jgi:bifunctional UDP-N-acetylglucosamine pyrophosphorylase/glucosamine-1-phosphate N-acetyltransferase
MQAVILAAGEGTRMRPLSASLPKPMLPVGRRPLVAHTAAAVARAGADELVFVVGYRSDAVRSHFGTEFEGVPVRYAVQREQRGTADAVRAAREHVEGPFAVFNGDNLYPFEAVSRLLADGPGIGVVRTEAPSNYGVVGVDEGAVTEIVEKPSDPPTNLANAGAYVLPERAREWLDVPVSTRGEHEITDVLATAAERVDLTPVEMGRWLDVGRPWELLAANEWKLSELERSVEAEVPETARLDGDVVVEAGATVGPGSVVKGPALLRAGARLGPNAYVRGATLLGPDATVGHGVEVKNSVLMEGATVGHLSYVGDSLLGRDANLGAGTMVANLRHDERDVTVTVKGERTSTGRRKFGAVVGDDVRTGVNTSLNPGVTLSEGARTYPGEVVTGDR